MGSSSCRSFDLNLQHSNQTYVCKLEVGQWPMAKINERRSLFPPNIWFLFPLSLLIIFWELKKFPVNRKTAENNTLSQKKVEIFHRTIKRFWTLLLWNCRRYQSSTKLWKQGVGCPTIILLTVSIQFSYHIGHCHIFNYKGGSMS